MPSVNMRQLRDTRQLKAWLQSGLTVELRERDQVIGHIIPEKPASEPKVWPNFAERKQKMFKGRILPGADLLIENRGRY